MRQWIAWLLLFVLTLLYAARPAQRWLNASARLLNRIARTEYLPEILVFVVALAVHGLPAFLDAVPPPSTHDEFAYLLAADTFARGRLTNPPHPLWEHFETFHHIMQPTYMAKFPPGQGLSLAAGQVLFGRAIVGAFVTVGLACAATCWMLRAWVPRRWALVGGLLAVFHPTLFWWSQIYWGGGVAMLGGALFAGAAIRAMRRATVAMGMLAGIGLSILALSRPFEGALFAVILTVLLIPVLRRDPVRIRAVVKRCAVGAAIVLAPVIVWMLYYNWRVTGDALTMPYVIHAKQYMASPLFWWQRPPSPPPQRHQKLAHFYQVVEHNEYDRQAGSARAFLSGVLLKNRELLVMSFVPTTLALALAGLPWALRRRRATRVAVAVCLLLPLIHMLLTPWMRIQYYAPASGMLIAALVLCLMRLDRVRLGSRSIGRAIVGAILSVQVLTTATVIRQMTQNPRPTGSVRAQLVETLRRTPEDHLVLVRYDPSLFEQGPGAQQVFEWVWNASDIDAAKVVFAHDMGDARNQRLLQHFARRQVWLLTVTASGIDFRPLPRADTGADNSTA